MNSDKANGSVRTYTTGFVLSIGLTLAAYLMVTRQTLLGWKLGYTIIVLAIVQFFVQMIFFLHAGKGPNRRWNLLALVLMITIVSIIVIGSLWIMHNLNYRMTPQEMLKYMQDQDGGI